VLSNGAVDVIENITYDFSGTFEGAWRDIPSRFGEVVDPSSVRVSEGGRAYAPGGTTTLGEPGPPDTFAVGPYDGGTRIVWRYNASDESRTFRISYRMTGLVKVYADTAELNVRVWGDQWTVGLGTLHATLHLPRAVPAAQQDRFRVWGHPREVSGTVERNASLDGATLEASGIAPQQWVELRTVFPPTVLSSTTGAAPGGNPGGASFAGSGDNAYDTILTQENAADAAERARAERVKRLRHELPWLIPLFLILLFVPGLVAFFWIARTYGRDPVVERSDYVHEPPSDDSPALVGALMREGAPVAEREFLATFFDLIRRGYFNSAHETTVHKHMLGHDEVISDLRITKAGKSSDDLAAWERGVYQGVELVVPEGGVLVSEMGKELKEQAKSFYPLYTGWKGSVEQEVRRRGWIDRRGYVVWGLGLAIFAVVAALGLAVGVIQARTPGTIPLAGIGLGVPGATGFVLLLVLGLAMPRSLKRHSGDAVALAAKWDGLRRFLADYSHLKDAPPASLALWEQLLVYGIVLGVADEVLKAAQIVAPKEMMDASRVYWLNGSAGYGGGLTMLQMGSLMSGIGRAVTAGAPHSSSSGFGGGFSGGGGFGGGGGGGGAW
jgi:uncharacterized membrane protein